MKVHEIRPPRIQLPSKDPNQTRFVYQSELRHSEDEKDALLVELDATDGFLRGNVVGPHSASHALPKTGGATDSDECTVCTVCATFAHHVRDKSVQLSPDVWTSRSEGNPGWEH